MQAHHQDHSGRAIGQVKIGLRSAHQLHQAIAHVLDHELAGGQALPEFFADGSGFDLVDEFFDHGQAYVGL